MKNGVIVFLLLALVVESYFLLRDSGSRPAPEREVSHRVDAPGSKSVASEADFLKMASVEAASGFASESKSGAEGKSSLFARRVADLAARKLIHVDLSMFDRNGGLNQGLIELLELDQSEVASVERILRSTQEKLGALTVAHAKVSLTDSGVVIDVKPFQEEGGAVYDELNAALEASLGRERYAILVGLTGSRVERDFKQFGAVFRSIAFKRNVNANSKWKYEITDNQELGEGSRATHNRNYQSRDKIYQDYPELERLLPEALLAP